MERLIARRTAGPSRPKALAWMPAAEWLRGGSPSPGVPQRRLSGGT
jgi:hypothetical protein